MNTDDILILYQHSDEEAIKGNVFCLYLIKKDFLEDFLENNKDCKILYTWDKIPVLFSLEQLTSQLKKPGFVLSGKADWDDEDLDRQRNNHLTSFIKSKDEIIDLVRRTINTTQFNPEND